MKISVFVMIAVLTALVALPASALLVNGSCESGTAEVAASGSGGTGNSGTALTGWTYSFSATPYGNWYIGTNVRSWNQRPGSTGFAVGMVQHNNPSGKTCSVQQSVSGLDASKRYEVGAWLLPVLVAGKASGATLTLGVQNPDSPGWVWGDILGDTEDEKGEWANSALRISPSSAGVVDVRIYITMGLGGWTSKQTPNAAWDDITITEVVPEPGSMIALLSGLVGLVGFGVRRRK